MNKNIIPHSLKLCRLCGIYDYLEIDILEESPHTGPNYRVKVFECCGVWVSKSDKLTTKLCLRCFEEIKRIDLFRSFCAATDIEIRMEFESRNGEDNTSSDEYVDDGDAEEYQLTSSIKIEYEIPEEQNTHSLQLEVYSHPSSVISHPSDEHDSISPAVKTRDSRDGSMCATKGLNSTASSSHSKHSALKRKGEKENVTDKSRKKIKRKSTKNVTDNRFPIKCRFAGKCSSSFECVDAMEYHMGKYHVNKLGRIFNCHLCRKRFVDHSGLRCHMRTMHIGFKPFKCSVPKCSKAFPRLSHLQRHTNAVHTQTRTYGCTICSKKFHRKDNLAEHLACKHGRGNRYCCYLCGTFFYGKYTLLVHFNVQHMGQGRYKCNVADCSFKSYYEPNLRQHLAMKHGK